MISPYVNESIIEQIFDVYTEAEYRMLEKVSKRLQKGLNGNGWAEKKAMEITSLRADIEQIMQGTKKLTREKMAEAMSKAYKMGYNSANMDLGVKAVLLSEIRVPGSVQRLLIELMNKTAIAELKILRSTMDAYREVIGEASVQVSAGVETRLKATQEALNRFADMGITGLVDRAGRRWEMATYAEVATRTTTGRAAIQGHIDRQIDLGRDLVIVSDHSNECELCRPWEGKILSISGSDPKYPSLDNAKQGGLFHPNCRHSITGYIPGLTKIEEPKPDPVGYERTQQQRYNERQIRKYKRRVAVALNDDERGKAEAKVRHWQSRQRDLLKDTDLRRKYNREGNTRAR